MLILKHIQPIRWALFGLMLVAIMGPWVYEAVNVPSPYPCTTGFRVDENFCGSLVSGLNILALFTPNIFIAAYYLIMGDVALREFLGSLLISSFFLPVLSSLVLMIRKDRLKEWAKKLHIGVLSLTILLGLLGVFVGNMFGNVKELWRFWGFWLYEWVIVSALVLELFRMLLERNSRTRL